MKEVPCKDCQRKGCGVYHDECETYQEWKAENDQRLQTIHQEEAREIIADRIPMSERKRLLYRNTRR